MYLIETKNLKKYYNLGEETEVKALKGIDLKIENGDFCSIVGVSGSGKSTLLYILGCIDKSTSGEYKFNGEDVSQKTEKELAILRNEKIGFVLQEFGLIEEETVFDNIYTPILFSNKGNKNVKDKIDQLLEKLGILDLKNKKVKQLSGGQRQRVSIGRALINDPEVILADEPTGSLDTKNSEIIMNIFQDLNKKGKTIIIVTHNLEIANKTKKIFAMKDGIICKV